MAVFKFNLQAVLDHRRAQEDDAQRQLAGLLREQLILQTQIRQMQQMMEEEQAAVAGVLVGNLDVPRMCRSAARRGHLAGRVQQYASCLEDLRPRIEAARQRLLKAIQHRKAIEILRDQQYAHWRDQQHRREAAENDEIGIHIHTLRTTRGLPLTASNQRLWGHPQESQTG